MMLRRVPIYKAEKDAGLAEQIQATASVVYASALEPTAPFGNHVTEQLQTRATNEGQIDLYYLKSILATIGWNKNDDILDKVEVWVARATPEDKPFNYEHDCKDIIGHITGNYAIDLKGQLIHSDVAVDELPEVYHMATTSVMYKYWPDKALAERMEKIIAELPEKKWFISMEALFDNFDYGVIDDDGKKYVVARNDKSAFLTKHLRAYGGSGVFEGKKVGRLLRNIIFSGKGLVRKPANPHSIIFDNVQAFEKASASSLEEINKSKQLPGYELGDRQNSNQESKRMADNNNTEVQLLKDELTRTQQTLAAAVNAQKEAEKRLTEMNEQAVKAKFDSFNADIKGLTDKVTTLTTQVETEQKTRTAAEAKVKELEGKLTEAQVQITKANAEKNRVARVATIASELSLSQADAEKYYDEQVSDLNMSDDRFAKYVASAKLLKGAQQQNQTTVAGGNDTVTTTPANTLDSAQAGNKTPPLSTDGVNTNVEQTRAKLASFLGKHVLRKGQAAQEE